jgi:flagellar FliL protein
MSETETTPPKSSKLVPALLVVNTLLVVGALAVALLRPAAASAPADHAVKKGDEIQAGSGRDRPGPTLKLQDFIVRLKSPDSRFARISIELELASEEEKVRFNPYLPRVRDAFLAFLSDRTVEDLDGSEALEKTKGALAKILSEKVPAVPVRGIYVTELVVQ